MDKISKSNFNKVLSNCISKYEVFDPKKGDIDIVESEKQYQESFGDIEKFASQFTAKQKKDIDVIIYHDSNNDGLFSGYLAWRYLYLEHDQKDLLIFPFRPESNPHQISRSIERVLSQLKGRNVFIADLQYGKVTKMAIANVAKTLYIIDDHATRDNANVKYPANVYQFVGDGKHGAAPYVWTFFYTKEPVPMILQYVDSKDRQLYLKHTPYANLFSSTLGFRISSNPYIPRHSRQEVDGKFYQEVHKFFEEGDAKIWVFMGKYFDEVLENIKDQIAVNGSVQSFQGYKVITMNFNAPSLNNRVARQLLTNSDKKGENVDFSVIWGWEYAANAYRVQLYEREVKGEQPKYDLPGMAKKLGKIGGTPRGGGGSRYKGNFYWPRSKGKDIWDLFTKQKTFL